MKNYWLERRYPKKRNSNGVFPADDELSLHELADSNVDLTVWYNTQFIQSEVKDPIFPGEKRDNLCMQHSPVVNRTMTGTIYHKRLPIQTFVHYGDKFIFQDIYQSKIKVTSIRLNLDTGEISFGWNDTPGDHNYVISYEYNLECQYNLDQ